MGYKINEYGEVVSPNGSNEPANMYNISFFTVHHHSNMHAYIDGIDKGKMPFACEVLGGNHHIMIKHLTNFRWKEIHFDVNIQKHTSITAQYDPWGGHVKIFVDDTRVR